MAKKVFSADFKAKVAIEAVKGNKTINELSSEFEVHATQIQYWKKLLTDYEGYQTQEDPLNPFGMDIVHTIDNKSYYPVKRIKRISLEAPLSDPHWLKMIEFHEEI